MVHVLIVTKMLISNGDIPSENASEVLNPDSVDGSPPISTVYTDVGLVPEHEKKELEHLISNLESIDK